jgi:acetylornithine deacetylase/succinyl-diaminopimelate desuccinylase-like protein
MTEIEKLLSDLIALPSVNPSFLNAGDANAGEQRVAELLEAKARRAGLGVAYKKALPHRPNLIIRLVPKGKVRQRILLAPHLDTVNGNAAQFKAVRRDGRMYGRGACDTKGSVAAMISALCEIASVGQRPANTEIIFAGLVDEENDQGGSRALARSGFKADLAIVGEPTRVRVVTAHKGSLWLRFETSGKAAHGARPELGRNAVHEMARIVDLLQTDYAARLRKRHHPLLGEPTVSVGVINGGTQPNIVPDRCSILVDRRTLPGETENGVRREIFKILQHHGLRAGCVDNKSAPCHPLETDPNLPLVTQLFDHVGQRKPTGVHYFSDAAVLAEGGIPSVVFGPGDIAQAHTEDEWVELKELEEARGMLARFLRSLP